MGLWDDDANIPDDARYEQFERWVREERGLQLYPAQEEALLGLALGNHVILATPTGTGKSMVALGAHYFALAAGQRSIYTAPIKALVSEKFFDLVDVFGAERVGMVTGDVSLNPDAPILCCTAEILANLALRGDDREEEPGAGSRKPPIGHVIMDEFHFYADHDRGWAWQVPLLLMNEAQFLLMSATLGDVTGMAEDLTRRSGRETELVTHTERPVPLHFGYETRTTHEVVELLLAEGGMPAYQVHFNQSHAVEQAQALASIRLISREQRDEIASALGDFKFLTGFGTTLSRLIRAGIGVHHAGMLPRYRRLVEQLAQQGLLRVICGTDTLGVGINVPIRTVVLTALTKFDGERMRRLSAREFHQVAGRAGRAGFDTEGDVIALAPEHEVENAKAAAKAQSKGAAGKRAKPVKKKQAPAGFVTWNEQTLEKLVHAEPEALRSRMRVTHGMLLNVIARGEGRPGEALRVMRVLIFDSHETPAEQFAHARAALAIFRTLRVAGIVEIESDGAGASWPKLTVDLQANFALDQPLSMFAIAAMELLDPESPSYALDLISLVESTLEDPRALLRAQEHRARGEAIAEMKAEGIDYEERMERLESITHPQPLGELIAEAFESYAREVPWARDYEPRPKSVVRDMVERAFGFRDVVSFYGLGRAEGSVLRYLSDAFRALERTVPAHAKTPELDEIIAWLGELVRQVDSSLLDEWAELTNPDLHHSRAADPASAIEAAPPARSLLENESAFLVMVRNATFRRVRAAALEQLTVLEELDGPAGFGADAWNAALDRYFDEYDQIGIDAAARSPRLLTIDRSTVTDGVWRFRQILDDRLDHAPEDRAPDHDWAIEGVVDLPASEEQGDAVIRVEFVGPYHELER